MRDAKKIEYNLIMGLVGQVMALVLGIVLPKLIITNYGSEVNGLLSSVTNIYAYIALVEAGIAAASCQALYQPIVQGDRGHINAVLAATNKYYHRTGIIYLGLVGLFAMIYPMAIRTEIPYVTVVLVILFNGLGNVINYFFHGKYLILLKADGKNYIRTGLETFTNAFKQISKIVLISLGYDVIFVQLVAMLASFLQMAYITCYIKKYYAWLNLSAEADVKALEQSKNVVAHEVNYLITANVDTVLLTVFTTLKTVSVYSLYNLLFSTVNRLLRIAREAVEFKIAHVFHEDRKAFKALFHAFEVYYISFAFVLFSITSYFVMPFIALYTKGVEDVNYIEPAFPLLFVLINLLSAGRYPSEAMVYIAGHFKLTQRSAMIETGINLVLSLLLVRPFGIAGVLIGTIISQLYRTNYLIFYVNTRIIGRTVWETYLCWGVNFAVFLATQFINRIITWELSSYLQIFAYCVPYALGVVVIHVGATSLCMPKAYQYVRTHLKNHEK